LITSPGQIQAAATAPALAEECDVCVVGAGAGGSVAAAVLAKAGAKVILLEEGGHYTKKDFNLQESWAYPHLYQDGGNRTTDDLGILILQGRSVGGGTTVNWTSSFRPPEATLKLWQSQHGLEGWDAASLAPHVQAVEERLSVRPGSDADVNANNRKLWEGAKKLGWNPELIPRNVKACARLGYCGMGCPLDAKQSAALTYVQDAVAAGADVYTHARAKLLEVDRGHLRAVVAEILDPSSGQGTGRRFVIHPRRGAILAGGAINTPALLLASRTGLSGGRLGQRTFLHPTVPLVAFYDEPIEGFYGAPQSVSCHEFAHRGSKVGFFLETSPVHPMLGAVAFPGFGDQHRRFMERLPHAQATIALLIDGHQGDRGGTVRVEGQGRIRLSYPFDPALTEAASEALVAMARLHLAAGAREIVSLHTEPVIVRSESDLPALRARPVTTGSHTLFSAHQMGGAAMGQNPATSVVNPQGRHHELDNVWVMDGSVFPTSLGVNPQLTIYAAAHRNASLLALSG
jgi:choline dehydrogenase-like flavoprotein